MIANPVVFGVQGLWEIVGHDPLRLFEIENYRSSVVREMEEPVHVMIRQMDKPGRFALM
jgi:hypothetical protein